MKHNQKITKIIYLFIWKFFLGAKITSKQLLVTCMLKQVLLIQCKNKLEDGMKINIRPYNYPESMIALKNLKAAYIGKFKFEFCKLLLC